MNASILALVLTVLTGPAVETAKEPSTHLYVRTVPPGAKILLDDQPGTTDGLFSAVAPGKHRIAVELDGYAPERREVDVPQGRITRIEVSLKPTNGSYDGRSMAEWKRLAMNDVSAETRAKAMDALAAFGKAGRTEEAVAAIKSALAREKNSAVIRAAYSALTRLGPPALPVLLDGLKSSEAQTRGIVVRAMPSYFPTHVPIARPTAEDPRRGVERLRKRVVPEEVISAMIQASRDADPGVRAEACRALGDLYLTSAYLSHVDKIVAALIKDLGDEELAFVTGPARDGRLVSNKTTVQTEACRALALYFTKAEPAVPYLVRIVQRQPKDADARQKTAGLRPTWSGARLDDAQRAAVTALGRVGSAAKSVLPVLSALQEKYPGDPAIRDAIAGIDPAYRGSGDAAATRQPPGPMSKAPPTAVAAAKQPAAKAEGPFAPASAVQDEADKVEDLVEKALRGKDDGFAFDQTPLTDVVDHLQRTMKINILLDARALEENGMDPSTTQVNLQMRASQGSALDFMLSQLGLTWTVRDGAMVITTAQKAQEELSTKVYLIEDLSVRGDSNSLIQILTSTIAPQTWDKAGGPGSITLSPRSDRLVVRQTYQVHRQIRRLLATLRTMDADAAAGKALEPVLLYGALTASPADVQYYRNALAQPASDFDFDQSPLTDVADHVARAQKLNVVFDAKALEDEGTDALTTQVTFSVRKIPLGQALSLLLERLGLTWVLEGDYVRITTKDFAEGRLVVGVYPVGDLAPDRKPDRLIETITQTISPEKWESAGGPGSIAPITSEKLNVLVISQTDAVHRQIAALLAQLRAKGQPPAGKPVPEKAETSKF